jgi:two-component system, cell cycle sensor histidine kinase and response regulator CckA
MHGFQGAELHRLLVEHSLGLMCAHDLDGVLLAVNPAVAESLGYSIEEGIGRNLKTFLAPEVQPLFDRYLERIRVNCRDSGLMRLVAKDGSERVWLYRNVLYAAPGQAPRVLGHALDVTERVHAEHALREAKRELTKSRDELCVRVAERTAELERANRLLREEIERRERIEEELLRARHLESLGVLAGGIAHDFNNFLTIIEGNLALAHTRARPGDPIREILDQASRACRGATSLGQQLLTFAKGGAPVRRTVEVAQVLQDSIELARAGSNATIEVSTAPDLWPADLDTDQIQQALYNLLLNARQAMPAGGNIEVRAGNMVHQGADLPLPPGRYVAISVRDCGAGIPAGNLARIFDPFFTTKEKGSGLGLTTAYAIARRHGGALAVESQPGRGSTFRLYLPASEGTPAAGSAEPDVLHRGAGRVLVMDDEEPIRRLLSSTLGLLGYEVDCAREGGEAITMYGNAMACGRGYAAVLLDLTVPGGMGGKATAAALRRMDSAVKIIASSGYSDDPVMSEFRAYGFSDVIPKPWTMAQLSAVFKRVVG